MQDDVFISIWVVLLVQVINQWLWRLWHAASGAAARLCGFLCGVCCTSERPLHFVKVELALGYGEYPSVNTCVHILKRCHAGGCCLLVILPCDLYLVAETLHPYILCACAAGGSAQLETPAGRAALQSALQAVLYHYRKRDIAAALAVRAARRQRKQEAAPASATLMPSSAVSDIESDSGWFDAARPERAAEPAAAAARSDAEASGAEEWEIQPAPPSPSCGAWRPEGSAQESAEPGAAAEGRQEGLLAGEPRRQPAHGQEGPQETPWVDLSTVGPLAVALEEVLKGAGPGRVSALLVVTPQRSTIVNSGGLSSVDGWPIKCVIILLTCGSWGITTMWDWERCFPRMCDICASCDSGH